MELICGKCPEPCEFLRRCDRFRVTAAGPCVVDSARTTTTTATTAMDDAETQREARLEARHTEERRQISCEDFGCEMRI